jgi:hypothetical protein
MKDFTAGVIIVTFILGFILLLMWGIPTYLVWQQEMSGRAQLAEAEWNRQIQIREAEANLESEKLNAQSEVERAKGMAQAIEIENNQLTETYIKYLWVRTFGGVSGSTIYIPTEAGLPILEARDNR